MKLRCKWVLAVFQNAALQFLGNHKNLGVHTEMFSDGVLPLIEKGVINGQARRSSRLKLFPHLPWVRENYMISWMTIRKY
jgi:hypothetical protein